MLANPLAPELASLASDAAVELDLLINGEATDLGSVKELARYLNETSDHEPAATAERRLAVDTATETILGRAFVQAGEDHASILSNLFDRTRRVASELSSADSSHDPGSLEWVRAFCLALSQSASAYRQLILNSRPENPYRR